ncbi:hypothetical protein [Rhizobium sp. BK176]|uniref:hypothetical protein n=1 Tax=Rhizobium sp. BK176 TaxID=2587071 RepID=UPI002166F452|nr:hypothetical protein [Rhizobium sp. BK176]MCS4089317.1 hypothetical protein [Rhizobium sp. BK176]
MAKFIIGGLIVLGAPTASQAAGICYGTRDVAAGWVCSKTDSKSADFTHGCIFVAAHKETYEVPCPPPPAAWAPAFESSLVGLSSVKKISCQSANMGSPTSINGFECKSRNLPNGGAYSYEMQGMSGGSNEQITRDFYCFASKSAVPTKGVPSQNDRTTYYACTGS